MAYIVKLPSQILGIIPAETIRITNQKVQKKSRVRKIFGFTEIVAEISDIRNRTRYFITYITSAGFTKGIS